MVDIYVGIAKLSDGTEVRVTGTIAECANWADNLIKVNDGAITIDIRRAEDERKAKFEAGSSIL